MDSGTWWERNVPSFGLPSTIFGPVQPFGEFSTIIGHAGRAQLPCSRAADWICRICSTTVSSVETIARCIGSGS